MDDAAAAVRTWLRDRYGQPLGRSVLQTYRAAEVDGAFYVECSLDTAGNSIDVVGAPLPVRIVGEMRSNLRLSFGDEELTFAAHLPSGSAELELESRGVGTVTFGHSGSPVTLSSSSGPLSVRLSDGTLILGDELDAAVTLDGGILALADDAFEQRSVRVEFRSGTLVGQGSYPRCTELELVGKTFAASGWIAAGQVRTAGDVDFVSVRDVDSLPRRRRRDATDLLSAESFAPRGSIRIGENAELRVREVVGPLAVAGTGTLSIDEEATVTDLAGTVRTLRLLERSSATGSLRVDSAVTGSHAQLIGSPSVLIARTVDANATSVLLDVEVAVELESLVVIDSLDAAQRVRLRLGDFKKNKPDRAWALRNERLIDAARDLSDRRCADGKLRSDWRMQQLRTRATLADRKLDSLLLRGMHLLGDASDVARCFWIWLCAVAVGTFLMLAAIDGGGWQFNPTREGLGNLGDALLLATLGAFNLVPSRSGVDLPTIDAWALPVKIVLTLLLAQLIASLVRRARWTPAKGSAD